MDRDVMNDFKPPRPFGDWARADHIERISHTVTYSPIVILITIIFSSIAISSIIFSNFFIPFFRLIINDKRYNESIKEKVCSSITEHECFDIFFREYIWLFLAIFILFCFAAWIFFYIFTQKRGKSSFRNPEDVNQEINLPVLLTLPYIRKNNKAKNSFFNIAFSELGRFFEQDKNKSIISIFSSISSEGKSFSSRYLAEALSLFGNKVLLVDADIYKYSLTRDNFGNDWSAYDHHKKLNVNDFLFPIDDDFPPFTKSQKEISKIKNQNYLHMKRILGHDKEDRLCIDFMPAGLSDDNHLTKKVNSKKEIKDYILNIKEKNGYDYVIFDTSPLSFTSIGMNLMSISDINVFCIKMKSTSRNFIFHTLQKIYLNNLSIDGLILNNAYDYTRFHKSGYFDVTGHRVSYDFKTVDFFMKTR